MNGHSLPRKHRDSIQKVLGSIPAVVRIARCGNRLIVTPYTNIIFTYKYITSEHINIMIKLKITLILKKLNLVSKYYILEPT